LSVTDIPVSVAGQQTWIQDIKNLLDSVGGGGKALGIVYWEPGWLDSPALGSACAVSSPRLLSLSLLVLINIHSQKDNLLFDKTGKARDSVNIFSLM
jgi:arabinogalactan endo-1,4-beta-galactosidase